MPELPRLSIPQEPYDRALKAFDSDIEQYKEWYYDALREEVIRREIELERRAAQEKMRNLKTTIENLFNPPQPPDPTPPPPA